MSDTTEPQLIALDRLLFGPNVPAGLDWSVLGLWHCRLRKTAEPVEPAIVVHPVDGTSFYRVHDGRHRVIAAIMAGRTHIEAIQETPCPAG
jgi:hypothetical protein